MESPGLTRLQQLILQLEEGLSYENVAEAVSLANSLKKWVAQEALFSRNEELEDVPTEHLPYLALPYYHGVALMNDQDMTSRLEALKFAETAFEEYLDNLKVYRALSEDVAKAAQSSRDPSRDELIARMRRKKELLVGLETLRKRQDTDSSREIYVVQLDLYAQTTLDHLKSIRRELPFLELRAKGTKIEEPTEAQRPPTVVRVDVRATQESNAHLLPGVISSTQDLLELRSRMEAKVFTPGHTLPTMTIEEFGELEYRKMQAAEAQKRQAEAEQPPAVDSDDEEEVEHKRREAASWDDWKDAHEKGAGNRMGRS
jgi:immunoglobulin-binding protein 1